MPDYSYEKRAVLQLLLLTHRIKHMENSPITRLVTGFSLRERRNDPAKAGFVKASGIGLVPICYAATKPKAYLAGFFALWPDRLSGSGEFCRAKTIRDSAPDATISQSNTPQSGLANGRMSSPHSKKRCAYWQASAVTFSGTPGTEQNGDVTTSPTIQGALEIEADLMGVVVRKRMARVGDITRLACPMDQQKQRD